MTFQKEPKSCSLIGQQQVFHLTKNEASSCCRAKGVPLTVGTQFSDLTKIWTIQKSQLDQGIEIESCEYCWKNERQGNQSFRQQHLKNSDQIIEIHANNLCNQMCSYCGPASSSTWQNNIQEFGAFNNVSKLIKTHQLFVNNYSDNDFWISEIANYIKTQPSNSVRLRLLGGEPLMQKHNLQKLLELNTDQIFKIDINTNLSPPSNKFLKWVLETFPGDKLTFKISLDTLPDYNSIPRAGFDKQKFEENLTLLENYKVSFSFLSVVSVLNIFTIADYKNWLDSHGYQASFFQLQNPDCLDPCYLPDQFKQLAFDKNLPIVARQALETQPSMFDLKLFEQYNYLTQYFQRTNTTITDPKLMNYWTWLTDKFK